jgi:hypothetical protein
MLMSEFICPEQVQCAFVLVISYPVLLREKWLLESTATFLHEILTFASETEEVGSR